MGYLMREQEALAQWDAQADPDPNGNGGSEWRPEWAHFEDALRDMMMQTRRYAQDQLTWFRKEPGFRWIRVENDLNNGVGPRTEDAGKPASLPPCVSCGKNKRERRQVGFPF